MIIRINRPQYEYDIHSLVKAFYPNETIKVKAVDQGEELQEQEEAVFMEVVLEDQEIGCRVYRDGQEAKQVRILLEEQDRSVVKSRLKQLLYQVLSETTGKKLPWGNLTGIRPAKIAYQLLEEGKTQEEIVEHMCSFYDVSRKKADLSVEIALRERKILSRIHEKEGYSLYIGIPFCPTTCLYCSFTSYPIGQWKKRVQAYLEAMEKEMDAVARIFKGKILDTVYIGGGTPTTLEPDELERLLGALKEKFDFSNVQEFTVEAGRADSITREKLQVLKRFGVDRISINPQTMKESTLKLIGRHHTISQVKEAFGLARELGFENINMDLILGLPEETLEDVRATMEGVEELAPDSLTVHSLAVKRGSALNRKRVEAALEREKRSRLQTQTEETARENSLSSDAEDSGDFTELMAAAMEVVDQTARKMGMSPYYLYRQKNMAGNLENVGYSRDDKYGIYNILIMEERQSIAAIGAGTVSKIVHPDGRIERCDTVKDVELYMQRIEEMIERKENLYRETK